MASNNARRLRQNPTDAEIRLWFGLRRRQIDGYRFRRQVPIGPFIAAFVCLEQRPIVEVDGGQHADNPADDRRTEWLERQGFRVLRFWNDDVLSNTEGVLIVIQQHLAAERAPLPDPPPQGGRGNEGR
jgi:very-short-patch-repair endonuclease